MKTIATLLIAVVTLAAHTAHTAQAERPNIILIYADDLGYGELGSYGQAEIETPELDRMAEEGARFTDFYAPAPVCAPSRGSLLTGLHTGNSPIRGNFLEELDERDTTFAHTLQDAGYRTDGLGKWGLGEARSAGAPLQQGFDTWFGYLNHIHAHNYFPAWLYNNDRLWLVRENLARYDRRTLYSHDLFTERALAWVDDQLDAESPAFLFLSLTIPHADTAGSAIGLEGMPVPDDAPYTDRDWPQTQKNHAAMITRMDRDIGRLLDRLVETGQAENTLVFFTSDNGPHAEGGADPDFFDSAGGLRGIKRDLYEGGIRMPAIAWWPGMIEPGLVIESPFAQWDLAATFAELAGTELSTPTDGVSLVPVLIGEDSAGRPQEEHEFLYWEFNEASFQQAIRVGDWKGVRPAFRQALELYNLHDDPGETTNRAEDFPEVVADLEALMETARTPHDRALIPTPADRPLLGILFNLILDRIGLP